MNLARILIQIAYTMLPDSMSGHLADFACQQNACLAAGCLGASRLKHLPERPNR